LTAVAGVPTWHQITPYQKAYQMSLINCTPHVITIITAGDDVVLSPSGIVPRLSVTRILVGMTDGIPVARPTLGETENLPAPVAGTTLVVSALVAEANRHRQDLASPGELVRNAAGQPIGCRGLSIYWSAP